MLNLLRSLLSKYPRTLSVFSLLLRKYPSNSFGAISHVRVFKVFFSRKRPFETVLEREDEAMGGYFSGIFAI